MQNLKLVHVVHEILDKKRLKPTLPKHTTFNSLRRGIRKSFSKTRNFDDCDTYGDQSRTDARESAHWVSLSS